MFYSLKKPTLAALLLCLATPPIASPAFAAAPSNGALEKLANAMQPEQEFAMLLARPIVLSEQDFVDSVDADPELTDSQKTQIKNRYHLYATSAMERIALSDAERKNVRQSFINAAKNTLDDKEVAALLAYYDNATLRSAEEKSAQMTIKMLDALTPVTQQKWAQLDATKGEYEAAVADIAKIGGFATK